MCIAAAHQPRYLETMTLIDTAGIFETAGFLKQIAKQKGGVNLGQMAIKRGRSLIDWTEGDQAFWRRFVASDPAIWTAVSSFRANFRSQLGALRTPTLILWAWMTPCSPWPTPPSSRKTCRNRSCTSWRAPAIAPTRTHAQAVTALIETFVRKRKPSPP